MHFTDAEVGLYMRLLCLQWSAGSIPDDDSELATYGKGNTPLARVKLKFKKGRDGLLRNERMESVRQKQIEFRQKQAENGKLGGRPSKPKPNPSLSQAYPRPNPTANPNVSQKKLSLLRTPSPSNKAYNKGAIKLSAREWSLAHRFEVCLNGQWVNDAGKWVNRIKDRETFAKCERVVADMERAIKDDEITTSPAQYAEQRWKEFA